MFGPRGLPVLEARFGRVPQVVARAVRRVKTEPALKRLVKEAAVAESLGAFRAELDRTLARSSQRD